VEEEAGEQQGIQIHRARALALVLAPTLAGVVLKRALVEEVGEEEVGEVEGLQPRAVVVAWIGPQQHRQWRLQRQQHLPHLPHLPSRPYFSQPPFLRPLPRLVVASSQGPGALTTSTSWLLQQGARVWV
jgi:hypothetical protein